MADRGRYDSAMFWLAFGTAAAVIGLALMTIGVSRSAPGNNLLTSPWFDSGLGILGFGALLLLWALALYLARRRDGAQVAAGAPKSDRKDVEAVRGYFAERSKLIDMWDRQERSRRRNRK